MILSKCEKNIFNISYRNIYIKFGKIYNLIVFIYFIKHFSKKFIEYIYYYLEYLKLQIRRYRLYRSLQPIQNLSIPFNIITIDFILTLLLTIKSYDYIIPAIYKATKKALLLAKKNTWIIT